MLSMGNAGRRGQVPEMLISPLHYDSQAGTGLDTISRHKRLARDEPDTRSFRAKREEQVAIGSAFDRLAAQARPECKPAGLCHLVAARRELDRRLGR